MTAVVVVGLILLLPALFLILLYNSLISKKNQVENTFASVDVLLKKRYDLIPNLVSTVKAYMKHEKSVLTEVTELRAKAISPDISGDEKIDFDNRITASLKTIMVSVENYPQLKANESFLHLQATLTEVEEQISAARRAYNAAVLEYNNAIEMVPTNMIASIAGFKIRRFFETAGEEREKPDAVKTFRTP